MTIPGKKAINRFTTEFRGSFGRFHTTKSNSLHYLTTTFHLDEMHNLATAADVFDADKTEFDELIQRDLDRARVRNMANEYLSQSKGAVFFPPLLACIALLDETGHIKGKYSRVELSPKPGENPDEVEALQTTFDVDGFQVALFRADSSESNRSIEWNGKHVNYFEYGASLKINPARAKLVVLDGQHRLAAIRSLMKAAETRETIRSIEVPVCIVWMPGLRLGADCVDQYPAGHVESHRC